MAKVIGRRNPLLKLTYPEISNVRRYMERARRQEEEDIAAHKHLLEKLGDIVEIAGRTYRRTEWILESQTRIEEIDELMTALTEYRRRVFLNLNRPDAKRGG